MTDSTHPNPASSKFEPVDAHLVAWLMRFRGTQRYARVAAENPADAAEADRLLGETGGRVLTGEEIRERWATAPAPPARPEAPADRDDPATANLLDRILEGLHASNERTIADRARLNADPLPVEIRRPNLTREERLTLALATALGVAASIAVVRRAARLLGVTLTRRQTLLLIAAARTMTRGSGYHAWTRLVPVPTRRTR